jgi:hypothetical protein
VGILSRVKAGWRRASNRVRAGAAAAAVIERQLNGFMGSWAGVAGTPAGRQSAHTHHQTTKQRNHMPALLRYTDIGPELQPRSVNATYDILDVVRGKGSAHLAV